MKLLRLLLILCFLILPIGKISRAMAMDFEDARHLALRAGFGADAETISALLPMSREGGVGFLLAAKPESISTPKCIGNSNPPDSYWKTLTKSERMAINKKLRNCNQDLKLQYFNSLSKSQSVLPQRMTLFWHNHFTSSAKKVRRTALIYQQHDFLARNALGNFRVLLHGMIHDAAMLIYLDNIDNKKHSPNENMARELLELFTLGVGSYSEKDIKEAARALTGLSVDREGYVSHFYAENHDFGRKVILTESGYFGPEGLVELILSKPQVADFIARKLWLEFVSEPDEKAIAELSAQFCRDWDIRRLVNSILLSPAFWSDKGKMIKSPVELIVGIDRLLPRQIPDQSVVWQLKNMGQDLFDPPNVKGWPKGEGWISSSSMMARISLGRRVVRGFRDESDAEELKYLCDGGGPVRLAALRFSGEAGGNDSSIDAKSDDGPNSCLEQLSETLAHPVWQLK